MEISQFMNEYFSGLVLKKPVFYSWDIGIRFELGVNYDPDTICDNCPYIEGVYNRANTLFKSLHSPDDELFIVSDEHQLDEGYNFNRKFNLYSKYVKEKTVLYKLQKHTIPLVYPEDDEEGTFKTHRFILKCQTSDFRYFPLLKAICNQDMGLTPSIDYDIYFLNITKKTIFHVYDDRGCDLLAADPEAIRNIYEKYNKWILDYDRKKIDQVFHP